MLKKEAFVWDDTVTEAFEALEQAMTQVSVSAMSDLSKIFVVETDASGHGIGAVLRQEEHPIAYFSRSLGIRAQQKPIYKRELMAIVFSILRWKHYLMGRKFVVCTDQFSLKFNLEQREIRAEYQK